MTKKTTDSAVTGHAKRIEDTKRSAKNTESSKPQECDWADTRHLLFSTSA